MRQDLVNHLDRQLRFLEHSCWLYDCGFREEGIRIATVVRVLIHQTGKSKSLLRQLDSGDIELLDTCRTLPQPATQALHGLAIRMMTSEGGNLVPNFNHNLNVSALAVSEWWNKIVCASPTSVVTRRQLVLTAANKDGGAHVDNPAEEFEYAALAAPGFIEPVTDGGPLIDAHLVALRQMGYELLNSPGLVRLAASADPLPKRLRDWPPPSAFRMEP